MPHDSGPGEPDGFSHGCSQGSGVWGLGNSWQPSGTLWPLSFSVLGSLIKETSPKKGTLILCGYWVGVQGSLPMSLQGF